MQTTLEYREQVEREVVDQVFDEAAAAFDEVTELDFAGYVESTVMLDPDTEVTGGPYNLDDNPFWRQILNDFVDPEVEQISVIKSTRVGGTLTLIAAAWGLSHYAPSPTMIAAPDQDSMKELRDRIYSTGEESPAYRDMVPSERNRNMLRIDFGNRMKAYQAWAGSAQRLRGRTCRYVFRSEVDVWPPTTTKGGDPLKASAERVGRFYFSKIYSESTPDGDPSNIDTLWENGNQSRWHCQCPYCGKWQELRFFVWKSGRYRGNGGIVGWDNENGDLVSEDEAREQAYYRCLNGCRIDNSEKYDMVVGGMWVPDGMRIRVRDGKPYLLGEPNKSRRHVSYHLWKIHIPSVSFGDIAAMYVNAKKTSTIKNFFQDSLGRKFSIATKLPGWRVLAKRLSGEHDRGHVPSDCWFLTAGADVQLHGVYWSVWGWGDRGTMWLIDWGFNPRYEGAEIDTEDESDDDGGRRIEGGDIANDIRALDDTVVDRVFRIEGTNPLGESVMQVRICNIDTNFRTREVQEYVRLREPNPSVCVTGKRDRVRTVRGKNTRMKERFKMSNVEKPQTGGDDYRGGMQLWEIDGYQVKEDLFERLTFSYETIGSIRFYTGIIRDGEDFLKQFCNERPAERPNQRTGRPERFWMVQSKSIGNHLWDTGVYARAAADMELHRKRLNWDASQWSPKTTYVSHDSDVNDSEEVR